MRIFHVLDHADRYNGMVHAAIDLACQQSKDGQAVALWSGGGEMNGLAKKHGVSVYGAARPQAWPRSVFLMHHMFRSILSFEPDIIHAHMVRSALCAWIISKIFGITLITAIQNSSSTGARFMTVGDGIITGCKAVMDTMQRRGVPASKMRPVLNGTIGTVRMAHLLPPAVTIERPAILTVCGLHHRKGLDVLISAVHACRMPIPNLHLYIIGDGPDRKTYEDLVSHLEMSNVHFCGYQDDTRSYMSSVDAFVLASRADPAPLVLSEAREAGLAIVASSVDGIPEMLEFGKAGLLVESGSSAALASSLQYLFSDPEITALWRHSSQYNIEKMHVSRVAAETMLVYQEFRTSARKARRKAG